MMHPEVFLHFLVANSVRLHPLVKGWCWDPGGKYWAIRKEVQIESLEEYQKYVEVFDEMKIKEAAVYDKNESKIVGFVNLALMPFEQSVNEDTIHVATRVLVFMVCDSLSNLSRHGITAHCLWSCEALVMCWFQSNISHRWKASLNRKFISMRCLGTVQKFGTTYKLN